MKQRWSIAGLLVAACIVAVSCNQRVLTGFETPPQIAITTPEDGAEIQGLSLEFGAQVQDAQDLPDEMNVVWTSSLVEEPLFSAPPGIDGFSNFTATDLPPGQHVIIATVTDTDGQVSDDSVEVSVLPGDPTVVIDSPLAGDQYQEEEVISFQGRATTALGEGELSYAWFSNLDGVDSLLAAGDTVSGALVTFADDELEVGLHTIRFEATDEFGNTGTDDVLIQITAIPVGPLDQDGDGWCPEGEDIDGNGECTDEELGPDGDCDDLDGEVYPGAPELCDGKDNDCDFILPQDERDEDGDGYAICQGDCDDLEDNAFPNNPEQCDGYDNDCDGDVDENNVDVDGDGWRGCDGDCNDNNPDIYPNAEDVCDGLDNNCDGNIDENNTDGDGDGYATCSGDCDDANSVIYPNAPELCDGLDNDCDGQIDEANVDNDGDGWSVCDGDCNDNNPSIYPNATELCDTIDNNCDGNIDETNIDADGDGVTICLGDCDDNNPIVFPGAPEDCDGLDNDCDGQTDENNVDADNDGVSFCAGDCNDANGAMFPGNPEQCDNIDNNCDGNIDEHDVDNDFDGSSICDGDCDDNNANLFPGNPETCDNADNDCDGQIDEHASDPDGDGSDSCDGDCNQANPNIYSGAPELCDGLDNNCDFVIPANEYDLDGDGSRPCAGDCDDNNPLMNPNAQDICDSFDNDCDGIPNDPYDPTEIAQSGSASYGDAYSLPDFNHIIPFPPITNCPGATCTVLGGTITLCRNNVSQTGTFAAPQDSFDAYAIDYSQLATTLGCEMAIYLSNVPPGHDYALQLYRTSNINNPVSSWQLLNSSDNPGSASEQIIQTSLSMFDFSTDTFVVVVLSKGNWSCPSGGNYTLTVTGG